MKSGLIITVFLGACSLLLAQSSQVLENKVSLFRLPHPQDTIEFVIVDTLINESKPVFLWCQGSLPIPLFAEVEGYGFYFLGGGVPNFDYPSIVEDYHLVVISMPHTPVLAKKEHLTPGMMYVPDAQKPRELSPAFIQSDYLETYLQRGTAVLDFLKQQSWVDDSRLVVAGHSQGSKVASKLAATREDVTHLGLFAPNPFGRIDQRIREARLDAQLGHISWEAADSIINSKYAFFKEAHDPDALEHNPGLRAWKSFSQPSYPDWLSLEIPIYLAYGTEDRVSDLCDLIPLFFIQEGRDHLTMKRYLGLEHNFFEVDGEGRPDYERGHWREVMAGFAGWIEGE